jgi:PEGA domain
LTARNVALITFLLLLAAFSSAATKQNALRIKVLDSETHSFRIDDNNEVPKNCDGLNYDAYCHSSKTAQVINTLLVQVGDDPPYRVSCAIDTKWSKCVPLEKGETFDARKEKRGITVYYIDDRGKLCKQLYTYVGGEGSRSETTATSLGQSNPAGPVAATPSVAAAAKQTGNAATARVKCSFTSAPAGAEVILDGRFIGSTPSEVSLDAGTHSVLISLPGFIPWNRDLLVSRESELAVNAVLQKAQ